MCATDQGEVPRNRRRAQPSGTCEYIRVVPAVTIDGTTGTSGTDETKTSREEPPHDRVRSIESLRSCDRVTSPRISCSHESSCPFRFPFSTIRTPSAEKVTVKRTPL